MPCVIADRISANDAYPSVATENFDAAYQGAKYLLSLGHRHITLAVNTRRLWNSEERIAGFERALVEGNAKADVRIVGMTVEEACMSIEGLCRERARPTALFASNNLVTLGALRALQNCRVDVPGEMSFLAFDDFEWLSLLQPAVSAIRQPVDQIAVEAWRLILREIGGQPIPTPHIRASGELIVRGSTAIKRGLANLRPPDSALALMQEILRMSDRIVVMGEGRITGELSAAEASQERIMQLATQRESMAA